MSVLKFNIFKESVDGSELHYWSFDWDDNILHMPTTILMDKKSGGGWEPVEVSTSEFAVVRNDTSNYRLRNGNPDEAFSGFRDTGPKGGAVFLQDVKKALSSEAGKGPSWDEFVNCIREGGIFSIITARGHEPQTLRSGVEYIIDSILSEDDRHFLYNNCLKHSYLFGEDINYERIPKAPVSKSRLIQVYLDSCDFYGVSSQSFIKEFGEGSASNPEHAKEMALHKFIEKCNEFGEKVGAKSVSVGFSDDDPKNVEHVRKMFKEKSALSNGFDHELKLSLYKTTDRSKKGGVGSKFRQGDELQISESSHQAPGMASSVMSFTQYNNMSSRYFPANDKDNDPIANTHRLATNFISDKSKEWTKGIKKSGKEKI